MNQTTWSKRVRERDKNRCVICGSEERVHAHHMRPRERFPELAFDVDNGITLCIYHHAILHGGLMVLRKSAPFEDTTKEARMVTAYINARIEENMKMTQSDPK